MRCRVEPDGRPSSHPLTRRRVAVEHRIAKGEALKWSTDANPVLAVLRAWSIVRQLELSLCRGQGDTCSASDWSRRQRQPDVPDLRSTRAQVHQGAVEASLQWPQPHRTEDLGDDEAGYVHGAEPRTRFVGPALTTALLCDRSLSDRS